MSSRITFPHRRTLLAAVLLSIGLGAAAAPAGPSPSAKDSSCGCIDEERRYTRSPTADVLALWAAANAGREAEFMRLLPKVPQLAEYAVEGRPLLAALLSPPASSRRKHVYWDMAPAEAAQALAAHQRLVPAKTRMLEAALGQGASVVDVTYQAPYPPLHLAVVFGSPEMVKLLLAAGAPVDRRDVSKHQTALEFLLDPEYFVRMTYLPPLVSRAQRGEMVVQLLQAGAQRPHLRIEEQVAKEGIQRPAADYLAWGPLVTLTEGAAPVHALLASGTSPVYEDEDRSGDEPTALALAAATGNVGALEALKPLAPASLKRDAMAPGETTWSVRLDAALAAVATGHVALGKSLVEPGMPLGQRGPLNLEGKMAGFARLAGVKQGSLLHFAVRAGDAAWVRDLVARGAPLEGPPDEREPSPLAEAMQAKQWEMVDLLLQLGANPLRGVYSAPAPLLAAIEAGEVARVKTMLSRIDTPQRRRELGALAGEIVEAWARSPVLGSAAQWPLMKQWLDAAGFEPKQLRAAAISELIMSADAGLVRSLVAAGAPVELEPDSAAVLSPLAAAVRKGDAGLVALLVEHGAKPDRLDGEAWLPIQLALLHGQIGVVEELLRIRPSFDFPVEPHGSAFDLAVASGRPELVALVARVSGRPLRDACITRRDAAYRLLRDEQFFDALLQQGLRVEAACGTGPGLLVRLYESLIADHALPWLGWQRESLTRLFTRLDGTGGAGLRLGEDAYSPLQAALLAHRPDVVGILLDSGASAASSSASGSAPAWLAVRQRLPELLRPLLAHGASLADPTPDGLSLGEHVRCRESESFRRAAALVLPADAACPDPAPMNAKEKALARRLVGHYYLSGLHEVGSELLLRANGKFEYMLAYGSVDESATGRWRVQGRTVRFSTGSGEAGSPMRLVGSSREAGQQGTAVRFRVDGRVLPGLTVLLTGAPAQQQVLSYEPDAADDFLRVPEVGDADTVAWRHDEIADGRWQVVELPRGPGGERLNRFDFELDPKLIAQGAGFNVSMDVEGKALLMKRSGRVLRYERP